MRKGINSFFNTIWQPFAGRLFKLFTKRQEMTVPCGKAWKTDLFYFPVRESFELVNS